MTPRQARFIDEYLIDLNGRQAAIRAGYAEKAAAQTASLLLARADIRAAIETAMKVRSEEIGTNAAWVLRLVAEAEADIADIYTDDGRLKPMKEWPLIWRQGLVQGIEVEELFEGHGKDREMVGYLRKVKLDSRIRRTELIGKHVRVQAFKDVIEHKGLDGLADRLDRAAARMK